MAISIVNITRARPAPCQHWIVQLSEDGEVRNVSVSVDEMRSAEFSDYPWKARLALLWMRYRLQAGASAASLVGQTVVS